MSQYISGLVSVVIPTYKRADLLAKAIDSVLGQTYKNIELLVVNDNIRDDEYSKRLYKIIDSYTDERLRLIEQEKHINGAAARNAGIRVAKGEYIAFQDDDDYWELEKIERQVKLLSSLDESWGAVSCLTRIYSYGKLIAASLPHRDGEILMDILDRRTDLGTGALLIRRDALDNSGYFDEALRRHQDLQLFARLAAKYKIKLDAVYLHNRENKDNRNRPSVEQLLEIKNAYFSSINDILEILTPSERKTVYTVHSFECAYVFIRNGKIIEGIGKLLGIFGSPYTIFLALNRSSRRIVEKKCKNLLQKKYCLGAIQKEVPDSH